MASRSFFADINLDQNELQFAVLHSLASAPSSGTEVEGQIYYDTGSNTPFFWNGSAWTSMSSAAASSVPWSGVTSGTNTNQTLVVGSNTIFLIGDGTLEFEGAGAGDMTLGTNLTGATDRTVNLPDVSATSTLIASSDTPAADQFVVATGSTEGIVEYRVIANSDIAGILALDDLTDVVITSPANPSYLRYNGSNWIDVTAATVASDVNGSLDHGSLTGLTDDDHSQYVYDSPTSSSRNLVTAANATTIPLTLRGASSHSAELFVVENSGGTDLFFIAADGDLTARGSIKGGGSAGTADSTAFILDNSGIGGGPRTFTFPNSSGEIITNNAAQNISGTKTFGSQDIRFESLVSSSHGWTFSTSKSSGNFDLLTVPPISTAATLLATADGSVTAGEFAVASNTTVGEITFRDLQSSDLPAISLDDLSDVVITTPANPSYLRYNGSNWIDVAESQIVTDIESSIDHGSIAGLSDDDHTQYVITSPSVSTRNVIESSSNSLIGLSLEYDVASSSAAYRPWFEILGDTSLSANLFSVGIGTSGYQVLITDAALTVDGASTFGSTVVINDVTTHNARVDIDDNSTVRFYDDDDSNYVAIDVPSAVTSNYTLTFPDAGPPGANYVLMADASGDFSWVDGSGVAVSDHGSLSGLGDDDHTQYHTDARALTWLGTRSTSDLPEGTNLYYTDERVDDRVASLIQDGTGITWTYDDGANTLTGNVSLASFSLDDLSDVDTSGASTNDLLQLNGSGTWVPIDPSTVGVTDHGSLSGLSDDDHAQYIIDDPANSSRNVIDPTADDTTSLTVQASGNSGSASFNILEVNNSAGSNLFAIQDLSNSYYAEFDSTLDGILVNATMTFLGADIELVNGSSETITIQPPASVTDWTFTLPADSGSSGEFLQTNGSGVTSWATALTSVALDDLTDVVITSPANPSYLRYNGSNWIDVAASQIVTDIESSIDHGSISGLSDDDHAQYITDAPTNDTRNQIVGNNGQRMLLDATNGTGGLYSSPEGDTIFRVQTNAGDDYLRFNATSNLTMVMQVNATNLQLHNNTPIVFKSASTNAADGVSLRASGTISSSYTITLPGSGPAASGNILYNTGSGTMAWGSHNNLSGLTTGDPHTQYVTKSPTSTSRNLITAGNSTTIPLTVRANATQAVDVFVVENSGGTNYLTIDNGGDATFSQDVIITGDLTVNGTTTTVNTTELIVEDNIIVVNSAGTVQNAGLEVERGASANASIFYNETSDEWFVDNASVSLQIARKYVDTSTIVGDSSTDTWDITHNMGTSDVIAVVYDSSDNQVETEIVITDSNTVTVNFAKPPATSVTYRVVVVG